VTPRLPGYGGALRTGIEESSGSWILSLEPEGWQDAGILAQLWNARHDAEVIIGSRYIPGARASMPQPRRLLSHTFNRVARRALSVPAHDISSGFRLYARQAVLGQELGATDYDVLEEIVIRAVAAGFTVKEVPFRYAVQSPSNGRVRGVAVSTLRTMGSMWKLRNSIASADYDARAHDSVIPLQRYWQRRRHRVITRAVESATRVLDVGCGSSRILESNPSAVGLDVQLHKLRYARRYGNPLVHGSIFDLPFADETFDSVICSEVIEHIPGDERVFDELTRVLRPNGRLILGTPDYDRWRWRALEWVYRKAAPGGYADEHITQYGQAGLRALLEKRGLAVERIEYVGGAEMIFVARKPAP
jgi:SAM-dependent methyltransferase